MFGNNYELQSIIFMLFRVFSLLPVGKLEADLAAALLKNRHVLKFDFDLQSGYLIISEEIKVLPIQCAMIELGSHSLDVH